jgi:hypothetical protein
MHLDAEANLASAASARCELTAIAIDKNGSTPMRFSMTEIAWFAPCLIS